MSNDILLKGLIEAFLFSSPQPVSIEELMRVTQADRDLVEKELFNLLEDYRLRQSAIFLRRVAGQWQMAVRPEYGSHLKEYAQVTVKKGISRAALEVLAIVSLEQPVTKIQIDIKRGVDSGAAISVLLERGLIAIAGQVDRPGKPFLYQLTEKFFEVFGLEDQEALQRIQQIIASQEVTNEVE
ncbi:MAG: SMC-Scp complex subunit ScpB [Atribacterota bacterium]|jgi:segregation and condensation protein B|uniref:Segregation and condensation protein B n=1 Tax=Candidatus Atribacter allofermentans TaxID=1852833 RepID=A0A1V5T3B6_9BACT|nr:SMC-Scp complex subunit ScpB [Atribacterota bacterium]OQA61247.1 MAG: Segregation and condensation protein B [Candidatus Atribacteria bacterium ADurb.Bin276]